MQLTSITVDENQRETTSHGSIKFPMMVYLDNMEKYDVGYISWHWHNEIEFAKVIQGEVELSANGQTVILHEGEGAFINSGVLHMEKPWKAQNAIMFTIVINTILLSDGEQSIIYEKYIYPLLNSPEIPFITFNMKTGWEAECLTLLEKIYHTFQEKKFAFEFCIRNYICEICFLIIYNNQNIISMQSNSHPSNNQQRIKKMITYIHNNYQDSIQLKDIASAAHISNSECYRCFLKSIGMKPFDYLIKFRMENAAQLLLESKMTISEIASATGFNSLSYFGKMFKQYLSVTPSEYRYIHSGNPFQQ